MTQTAALDPQPSIARTRRALAQSFRRHGLSTPELDARLLVAHALGLDHAALAADAARILSATEADAIAALAARRRAREPVARIIGVKEFWGLDFKLNGATLVPRPETETVIEAALALLDRAQARCAELKIADLGTGSGALLLAFLSELPLARGVGTDMSRAALDCARHNAAGLGLAARAAFIACDFGAALQGPFDLIVSNPPYVRRDDIATLAPEVRVFDPWLALDGGADGLDAYRSIATTARRLLSPDGVLVLELGAGQLDAVEGMLAAAGLLPVGGPRHDLLGIARALAVKLAA
jgi:release factor glutamine methyltransferase